MSDLFDQAALLARAEALVEAARKAGADAADCIAVRGVSQDVSWREGRVESADRAEGDEIGLRVFTRKHSAIISSNDSCDNAHQIAERAMTIARATPEDPFCGPAERTMLANEWPHLDVLDTNAPTIVELENWASEMEAAALAVPGVSKSGGASASTGLTGLVLVTSDGFAGQSIASWTSLSVTAVVGDGTMMQRDHDHSVARHTAQLKPAAAIGQLAGERAAAALNPRKLETRKAPVVFDRRIAGSFVGHLLSAINGQSIARKMSFLRDDMGKALFRRGVTIIDDPLRPRGLASRGFDAEGVKRMARNLIDDGHLTTWLLDSASGRELGLASTGHATRGASGPPHPSATNVHMVAGDISPQAMLKEMGTGLLVTGFIGHGANLVTGDYSRGCNGFWIENGEIAYPVAEITLAGDLRSIFSAIEPANDLEFINTVNAPSLRVEGLTIAGR